MMKLEDVFYYDESSPSGVMWKIDRFSGRGFGIQVAVAGTPAGCLNDKGYYTTWFNKKPVKCQNIVAELAGLKRPGEIIDHIDGVTSNNKIENLRSVTKKVNGRNLKKYKSNTTGVTGVSLKIQTDCGKVYGHYVATCKNLEGKQTRKYFNIEKLGKETAFEMACLFRKEMIAELNKQGAGYLEREENVKN